MLSAASAASLTASNKPGGLLSPNDAPSASPVPTPPTTSSSSIRDALNPTGFHTDGRVRNPVPTKLQGMTNKRNGNFAVMHIDLTGTKASDRNAAAKRTSEETEAQARRANQVGWQPVRRTKFVKQNDELHPQRARDSDAATPPSKSAALTSTPAAATATAVSTTASVSECLQTRIPAPRETKAEQARLLTLLRTLHPILVVDQLCKALAYFGGIPGAPPPVDGAFPSSAATNGPGSLLVRWLAEIFPPVDDPAAMGPPFNLPPLSSVAGQTGWDRLEATVAAAPSNGPVKRARGRPKGSKSSKVRKDKGMKKSRPPLSTANPSGPGDVNKSPPTDGQNDPASNLPITTTETSETLAGGRVNPEASIMSTPGAKKRGRPKGSKNRPKEKPASSNGLPGGVNAASAVQALTSTSPKSHPSDVPPPGAPATPEDGQDGPAPIRSLTGVAPRNEPSLPDPAVDMAPQPGIGSGPPMNAAFFPGQGQRKERDGQQKSSLGSNAASFPRTTKRPAQYQSPVFSDRTPSHGYSAAQTAGAIPQDRLPKRRRTSKETIQQPSMDVQSQTLSPESTASPALSHGFTSASPQLSASRSFESHTAPDSRPINATTGAGLGFQQQQHYHPLHQQQQRTQCSYAQQSQHPSPSSGAADRHSHGVVQTSGPPPGQTADAYGAQRHAHLSPQMIYKQKQQQQAPMRSPMGSLGRHGSSLGPSIGGSPRNYSQGMEAEKSGGDGAPETVQQRNTGDARGPRHQGGSVMVHGSLSHQHPPTSSHLGTTSSFQSFSEQSYLNMDYGLTERDVQDAAAVTALGSPSQPEQAPALPKRRDQHVFQGIGRQ